MESCQGNLSLFTLQESSMVFPLVPVASMTAFREKLVDMSVFSSRYPPKSHASSSIEDVLRGSGAPGIFNSSEVLDEDYGIYDWCNMPHVRATEYPFPSPDYTLEYVEVVHRHHKRTPYRGNIFPEEDITWDCSSDRPYHYARNASGPANQVVPISWQGVRDEVNPWAAAAPVGFKGSNCQFPQVTAESIVDAQIHGEHLREVYHDRLGFLPAHHNQSEMVFRVTNNEITSQVFGGIAKGLYPDLNDLVANIQSPAFDSLEPAFSCKLADQLRANYTGPGTPWAAHLQAASDVFDELDAVSGIVRHDNGGWHTSFDHYYDNLSAKQCHSKALPCNSGGTGVCVNQELANTVYRLGQFEYSYLFRDAKNSTAYSTLRSGPWMMEVKDHIESRIAGSSVKYRHNIAHDGSLAALLGFLQIDQMVWPGMGAEIVFEVWKKDGSARFVRVLWGGQPMKTSTPLGTLSMVALEDFLAFLDAAIPEDMIELCSRSA